MLTADSWSYSKRVPTAVAQAVATTAPLPSRISIDRARRKLIAARAKFQCGPDFLRSEESPACVVPVVRERERVVLPTVFALPHAVARTAQGRARTGTDAVFRHGAALVEREQAPKRREGLACLTVARSHQVRHTPWMVRSWAADVADDCWDCAS